MSGIRNPQRRALEALIDPDKHAFLVKFEGDKFYLDEEQIFFLGTSRGVGTCSDMHGIDIAVFSDSPPEGEPQGELGSCSYAALSRPINDEEKKHVNPVLAHMVVEGLDLVKQEWNYSIFRRNSKKTVYVNTI